MSGAERHSHADEARRWLARADDDRRMARVAPCADPPLPAMAALHVQQAAETMVKGLLILAGREVPRSRDLALRLHGRAPGTRLDAGLAEALSAPTPWAIAAR